MIKAQFNNQNFIIGYFPNKINYPNNLIDTEAKTIDGLPYIEITEEQQQEGAGKQMCVIDGIYQEYVKPADVVLAESKVIKLNQLDKNREEFCLIPVEYQGKTYATTLQAWSSITYLISILSSTTSADYYTYPEQEKVSLTKADFKAIAEKIQTREIQSRDKREDLKTEINNASSIEELNSINIEFN